jgi:MFS family permease
MSAQSQFELLRQRRFLPFFLTQFLGAFNDNAFKNALVIMIAFHGVSQSTESARFLGNLSAVIFIAPFFLFSSTAGQIGDSVEKSWLMRQIKLFEIIIMSVAVIGFMSHSVELLMVVLFFMGTQSAFFGPVKYGYLPQHLDETELVGGNGLVEMGTFLAILAGMLIGGYLLVVETSGFWVSMLVVAVAITGYLCARMVPYTSVVQPDLQINWNIFSQTWRTLSLTRSNRTVFHSVLGISWFWFIGSTYMVQLPVYTRKILGGDPTVFNMLIGLFCIGIGVGSILCEKLSHHRIETALVPLGAIGLTLFGIDLYFATPELQSETLIGYQAWLGNPSNWRSAIDIIGVGVFGGFYIVPLFAVVQQRTRRSILSRVIAGNNILNAVFMVLAALFAMLMLVVIGIREDELYLILALLNILVIGSILMMEPEFIESFRRWLKIQRRHR